MSKLHGWDLSPSKIDQAWPGAPEYAEEMRARTCLSCSGLGEFFVQGGLPAVLGDQEAAVFGGGFFDDELAEVGGRLAGVGVGEALHQLGLIEGVEAAGELVAFRFDDKPVGLLADLLFGDHKIRVHPVLVPALEAVAAYYVAVPPGDGLLFVEKAGYLEFERAELAIVDRIEEALLERLAVVAQFG